MNKVLSFILVIAVFALGAGGYYIYNDSEGLKNEITSIKQSNLLLNDKMIQLEADLNTSIVESKNLQQASGLSTVIGLRSVNASRLNIRVDESTNKDPVGTLSLNTLVEVIDTSNPLWYKIKLDPWQYENREELGSGVAFKNNEDQTVMFINSRNISNDTLVLGDEYYVSSRYLTEPTEQFILANVNADAQNPFIYGLIFFEEGIARILESQIWSTLEQELTLMGYDGVSVVPYSRDEFQKLVKDNYFDAVESAPGEFVDANLQQVQLEAFAKTRNKLDNSNSYSGIIITNKNAGITSFDDLRGRDIIIPGKNSESGFVYQRYYLNKVHGIDIENESNLLEDHYHQDVFLMVARGDAQVGFCGDFVIKDPPSRFARSAETLGITLETPEQLRNLRNQIIVHPMEGMSKIPNNPHSVRKDLASNVQFVSKLRDTVMYCYETYREDFGLVDALSQEYDFLKELR